MALEEWPNGPKRTFGDNNLAIDFCPRCRSTDIVADRMEGPEDGVAWQTVTCNDCGATWRDVYALVQQEPAD